MVSVFSSDGTASHCSYQVSVDFVKCFSICCLTQVSFQNPEVVVGSSFVKFYPGFYEKAATTPQYPLPSKLTVLHKFKDILGSYR